MKNLGLCNPYFEINFELNEVLSFNNSNEQGASYRANVDNKNSRENKTGSK